MPAILRLQRECYPESLLEDPAAIRERLAIAREDCRVSQDAAGLTAYLFAYRSRFAKVTPLGGRFDPTAGGDTFYLHDLAVARRASGRGLGSRLVAATLADAAMRGFVFSALVCVQESLRFRESHGFQPHGALDPAQRENRCTYPGTAIYMTRRLIP